MKRFMKKTFVCLFALILGISIFMGTSSNVYAASAQSYNTDIDGRTDTEIEDYLNLIDYYQKLEKYNEKMIQEEENEKIKKDWERYNQGKVIRKQVSKELKDAKNYVDLAKTVSKSAVDWIENGENADHIDNIYNISKSLIKLGATCFGYGGVADVAFGVIDSFAGLGESSESEMKQLQNHLDEKFDEVDFHLDEVQRDIRDLSKKVDSQTVEIINALSDALEANTAKQELSKFMSSRDGNFDYNLFKEFLYSSADPESEDYSINAYYYKLIQALADDSSDVVIKDCYDNLYKYINVSDNRTEKTPTEKLYDYMFRNEYGMESIQYYYYEFLNANKDSLDGEIPAFEAMNFTLDLYQTALFADYCIEYCNAYQILHMSKFDNKGIYTGELRYYFGSGDNDYLTYNDVVSTENSINAREEALVNQILSDIAVFYKIGDSFALEGTNESFRVCKNNDAGTFGNVKNNETIYLNRFIPDWCDLLGIDANSIEYTFSINGKSLGNNNGTLNVNLDIGDVFLGSVSYNGNELYSITFFVENNAVFSSGTGSENDPYVISTPEQFRLIYAIEDAHKKHYELANSIDLAGVALSPISDEMYKFEGSFNGNGNSLYNLNISDNECGGLFGYIGPNGKIFNLNIAISTFTVESSTNDKLYVGAFAGRNEGTLYNCHVTNYVRDDLCGTCSITANRNTSTPNNTLYIYAGGIVGENSGKIRYCSFDSSTVKAESYLDYQTNSDSKNRQYVYVGGIFGNSYGGEVSNCYTGENAIVNAVAKSECTDNLSSRHPFIDVFSGGIGANVTGSTNITKVLSDIKNVNVKYSTSVNNTSWSGSADYNRVNNHYSEYVASFNDSRNSEIKALSKLETIAQSNTVNNLLFEYNCAKDSTYRTKYVDQIYNYKDSIFKTENLWLIVDGEYVEYEVLGYYGFKTDVTNYSEINGKRIYDDVVDLTVTLLVYIDGYNTIKSIEIPIIVKKVLPIELIVEVNPNKVEYDFSEIGNNISLDGASIKLVYADGYREDVTSEVDVGKLVVDQTSISEIRNVEFDENGMVSNPKKQAVKVSYEYKKGVIYTAQFEVGLICNHSWTHETVANHCEHLGYSVHICEKCGSIYKNNYSLERLPHDTVIYEDDSIEARLISGYRGAKQATCIEKGYTGDVYCVRCNRIVETGIVIDYDNHTFDNEHCNALSHNCVKCGHSEQHYFRTIECDDSVHVECIYCHKQDTFNVNSRSAIENLPRITISNVYATEESKEVVVFVELHANTGITSAYFSVRYQEGMTLVDYQLGNILTKPDVDQFKEYCDHLNVQLAHRDAEYSRNGTLLKLVFNLPDNCAVGDEFIIEIAGQKITDANNKPVEFLTFSGIISVVDRLPGDVNGDNVVDILDATLIAKHKVVEDNEQERIAFVNAIKEIYPRFDISYGDVTLDSLKDGEDIVNIIRYFVGGYDVNLWANQYKIILDYNNPEIENSIITVEYNNGTGTYGNRLIEAEIEGYRFDGWYRDRNYTIQVDAMTLVRINRDQLKQTLYAHYTQNTVSFNGNGNTNVDGNKQAINYSDYSRYIVDDEGFVLIEKDSLSKTSTITFKHGGNTQRTDLKTINHTLLGWATSPDGNIDESIASKVKLNSNNLIESIDLKDSGYDGVGNLTLYAVWSVEKIEEYPADPYTGYKFLLWEDSASIQNWNGIGTYEIRENKTFDAQWAVIEYIVVYIGNGGTRSGATSYSNANELYNINQQKGLYGGDTFVRQGFTSTKWNTKADGSGTPYLAYQNVGYMNHVTYDANLGKYVAYLYAVWDPNTYTIKYNKNTSDAVNNLPANQNNCVYNGSVTLGSAPSRTGFTFEGWYKDAACTNKAGDAEQTVNNLNLVTVANGEGTLYASWKRSYYTITYNPNGGTLSSNVGYMYVNGTQYGNKPTATRSGYIFVGYYDNANIGSGTMYYDDELNIKKAVDRDGVTLYAHWVSAYKNVSIYGEGTSANITGYNASAYTTQWLSYSQGLFGSNYTSAELAELSACGYANISMEISMQIKDSGMTYQALALQRFVTNESTVTPNSSLAAVLFYVATDSDYSAGNFETRKLYYSVSTSMLTNPNIKFRLAFGTMSGQKNMMWTRGAVSVKFTPSKTASSTYAAGGWYQII